MTGTLLDHDYRVGKPLDRYEVLRDGSRWLQSRDVDEALAKAERFYALDGGRVEVWTHAERGASLLLGLMRGRR